MYLCVQDLLLHTDLSVPAPRVEHGVDLGDDVLVREDDPLGRLHRPGGVDHHGVAVLVKGPVTNSIPYCWLYTIKDRCRKACF